MTKKIAIPYQLFRWGPCLVKLKLTILFIILITVSGCSEFAILMSGSSIAISQNAYVKAYNSMDVLTIMHSDKSIKKHIYENTLRQYKRFHP